MGEMTLGGKNPPKQGGKKIWLYAWGLPNMHEKEII